MRLSILDKAQRPFAQFFLDTFTRITGFRPGPIAVNSYRCDLFGKHFSRCIEDALRTRAGNEHSAWHKSQLELFAAFVSKQLACQF